MGDPSRDLVLNLPNNVSLEMVYVSIGSFVAERTVIKPDMSYEKTCAKVSFDRPFWIGKYPVTQHQYESVMNTNPSSSKGSNLPVESISWYEATIFCMSLTQLDRTRDFGSKRVLPLRYEFNLPTENQWEYSARGGDFARKEYLYSGSDDADAVAWYESNSTQKAHPVGLKSPNELGVYDMSGNVMEWCRDWVDPYNPQGASRALRGGSWLCAKADIQVKSRSGEYPEMAMSQVGFRIVCALES